MQRTHTWGLEQIDESGFLGGENAATAFYGYDGHGSVRYLTNAAGAVTDTYDYDAFGNRIASSGSTINNTLFAGEWFDPALRIYYNRARYYDERSGRFWTMDTDEGNIKDPRTLHRYLYTGVDPVNSVDPSGNDFDLASFSVGSSICTTLTGISSTFLAGVMSAVFRGLPDAIGFGFFFAAGGLQPSFGGTLSAGPIAGLEIVLLPKKQQWVAEVWGGPLEGAFSLPSPGETPHLGRFHSEIGAFGAWYWNVNSQSNFTGILGGAIGGNFYGLEQSGGSTALLFGITNDSDLAAFGIGVGAYEFSSGQMSEGGMIAEALGFESLLTVGTIANFADHGLPTNGIGGLAALIINDGAVATWINHTWGQPE